MTDFDFEILAAVALYEEEGVSRKELECTHFNGYKIDYNLRDLAEVRYKTSYSPDGRPIQYGIENSACLKVRTFKSAPRSPVSDIYEYYSLTDKGRALLQNWQRRREEKAADEKRREINNVLISCLIGVSTGVVASIITKMLGL